MSFARADGGGPAETEVRMKVLIGVDPHKASLAVAAVDEVTGELLERAFFAQETAPALGHSKAGLSDSPIVA
jgi:hypothetical protein